MDWLNSIGLLEPGALYFLTIVPALILAYLARERPRQATVSSVIAFRALHVMRGQRFGGRPRFPWTFFLELLALCLAVLAMARPYVIHRGSPIAVVIDNSAAMQALTASGQQRFAKALSAVKNALGGQAGSGQVTVYLTAPRPHQLGGMFTSTAEADSAIGNAQVSDAPDDPAAVASLMGQLNADTHIGKIIWASYRPITAPIPAKIKLIAVGEPIANYAIGSFALSRESFGATALHARLAVANFSPSKATLHIAITGDDRPAGHAQIVVEPGEVAPIELPNLAPAQIYRAKLQPADGFALDNLAYATASAVKAIQVLFVSPVPADGQSLASIPGVTVRTVSPANFTPKDLADCDLALFEYTVPKELPAVPSLLVMPPPGDPVFGFGVRPAAQVAITGWLPIDPLTDGVNFRLLNLRSGEYLAQHPWMQAVVTGSSGGLVLSGQREGHRFIATGFNPLPYLGVRNLPMSVLTLNMLGSLAGFGARAGGFRTGEPWTIPSEVTSVTLPSGRREAVQPGTLFTSTDAQGVYYLEGRHTRSARAVNLSDLVTSDLENAAPITIAGGNAALETATPATVRAPLTPYLLAAILLLIVLESLLVYRRRPAFQAQAES
jgi:Aerotolerance regulator N-terminal